MRFLVGYMTALHRRMESLCGPRIYRLIRYLISGGTAAASNLLFLFILVQFFGMHYLSASVLAFIMSVAVSFTMQKFWTFQDTQMQGTHMQFGRYIVVMLFNLFLNTLLMYIFVEKFSLWYLLAQFITTALVAIVGYFGYKYFVFRREPSTRS